LDQFLIENPRAADHFVETPTVQHRADMQEFFARRFAFNALKRMFAIGMLISGRPPGIITSTK
jgi:hypothetical protein